MRMYNPPHPGSSIKEAIEALGMTTGQFAEHIGVSRNTVSRIVNEHAGVTADMSLRISEAFGQGTSGIWFRMQNDYDLWQAEHRERTKVTPIPRPAQPDIVADGIFIQAKHGGAARVEEEIHVGKREGAAPHGLW